MSNLPEQAIHNTTPPARPALSQDEQAKLIYQKEKDFYDNGGTPVIWKKPYYLLFAPIFTLFSVFVFIFKFQPSLLYSIILVVASALFMFFRYEEFEAQEIAIYPFKLTYTYKVGLTKIKQDEFRFGSSDFKYLQVEPYTMEHLLGFMRIFSFIRPQRWFSTSNVYIYSADFVGTKLVAVYQCELFRSYLTKKIDDFLTELSPDYASKTGVMINGHIYEEKGGKLIENPTDKIDFNS